MQDQRKGITKMQKSNDEGRKDRFKPHHSGAKAHSPQWDRGEHKPQIERFQPLNDQEIDDILSRKGDQMVKIAKRIADAISDMSTTQLRNFYNSLLKLESRMPLEKDKLAAELQLLRPKLAYMVNRDKEKEKGSKAENLRNAFDGLLDKAAQKIKSSSETDFAEFAINLFDFAEAVVAYHRGGKQK